MISTPARTQPPSIEDPEEGNADLWTPGTEDDEGESEGDDDQPNWRKRALDAFQFSTSYVDSNYRTQWDYSIRAFNNQHPGDSKYGSELFRKRSCLYRPKTRSVIRKNEAAAAAAFFSNLEVACVSAVDQSQQDNRMAAEVMQALLQHRLTKSIPWFHIVQGGLQDAQVQGACIAHIYWLYQAKNAKGRVEIIKDQPVIDLIPIENLRIDPGAHWQDPINTSPYLIHLIPMYVCDIKEKMAKADPKGRKWKTYDDSVLSSMDNQDDTTRSIRIGVAQDPTQQRRAISDYDIVWVHRHIHRWKGQDWEFYTLASRRMLTDPEPLTNTVFHGNRPYVMGVSILETHKVFPVSLPKLTEGLQAETNEVTNQRLDNVKFVMNKRWIARRGKNVDTASLVRNVPGSITLADNIEDIQEIQFQDVTASSYLEQDRINADFDELTGNFSSSSVQMQSKPNQPARSIGMLQAPANLMTEYMLKTYVETFIQPVLRHIVMLEQHYETDDVVLALAGQKAQANQKYGISEVTDELLDKEVLVNVNVGMGATDPVTKLNRFVFGVQSFANMAVRPPPGINLAEVAKEIFALSGYQDGTRFSTGQDPDKVKMAQQIQQLMMMLQKAGMKLNDRSQANVVKMQSTRETNATKIALAKLQLGMNVKESPELEHAREMYKIDLEHERKQKQLDQEHARKVAQLNAELHIKGQIAERDHETKKRDHEEHKEHNKSPVVNITNVIPKSKRHIEITRGENGLIGKMEEE